jgi:hypothetical protein
MTFSFPMVAAVLGWVGAVSLLAANWLVSTRRITGHSTRFQCLNLLGAVGLCLAAIAGGVWSAAVLNTIAAAIAIGVLGRHVVRGRELQERR